MKYRIMDISPVYTLFAKAKKTEYDQEMPQSHTADQPTAPWGRDKDR